MRSRSRALDSATDRELHQKLERLQEELAQRRSTAHFARASVFSIVALMALGAAAKLRHDFPELLWAWGSLGLLGALIVSYCLQQYLSGRRCLARELEGYEKLKALRQVLKVDDPPALLPE